MSGSGNTQRKAVTAGCIPGVIVGMMQWCRRLIKNAHCADPIRSLLIPRVQARSAWKIWSETFGSGATNSATNILARRPYAAEVITSRKDRYGTFHLRTD